MTSAADSGALCDAELEVVETGDAPSHVADDSVCATEDNSCLWCEVVCEVDVTTDSLAEYPTVR